MNKHASENVSDNDPVKIVDGYSVNSPQIVVSDNKMQRSRSRSGSGSQSDLSQNYMVYANQPNQNTMRL